MSHKASSWAWEQRGLTSAQRLVLLALADHADSEGVCWPGRRGVAERCEISPGTVTRHLGVLEELGLIRRQERFRGDGSRTTDRYVLSVPPLRKNAKAPLHESQGPLLTDEQAPLSPVIRHEPSVEPSSESSQDNDVVVDVFEHWRQAFSLNGQTKLTDGRRAKIRARLKTYPAERLKRAIDGCAGSQWHRDNNHFDLELIFRSDTKLEEFERRAATAKAKPDYSAYERAAN